MGKKSYHFSSINPMLYSCIFNQVFNENWVIVMLKSVAGGRAGVHQLLVSAQLLQFALAY